MFLNSLYIRALSLFSTINAPTAHPTSITRRQSGTCPSVWSDVAADLKTTFVADNGTCTADARAAIRLVFHDCFPSACDGSIILANECSDRAENAQMVGICGTLGDKATQYNVSTADMIQFAGAIGVVSCPGGPAISFYAGRTDNSTANPTGQMPSQNSNATVLISQFQAKGFTAAELVALVGAHTAARQLSGAALDSTPGTWDTDFYTETADGSAPSSLNSDRFLSNSSETSDTWQSMAASSSAFSEAFVPAMEKMSLLGNDINSLTDCSSIITDAASSSTTSSQKETNNTITDDETKKSIGSRSNASTATMIALSLCAGFFLLC